MGFRPISLEFKDRLVVIIGGGEIALRRAHFFANSGAKIHVYTLALLPQIKEIVTVVTIATYEFSQLKNAFVVIAATNDDVLNWQICSDGRAIGALVNNVSDRSDSDFHIPAVVESGSYTVAVSSGGIDRNGAVALRNRIQEIIND